MIKISIMGKARTGKNTLARMLVRQLRQQRGRYITAKYLAFADPLKEMAKIMFPTLPKKWLYGSSQLRDEIIPGAFKDGKPLTVRQLLIDLGTGLGRGYKDNIWLDNFDHRFVGVHEEILVCPDVRFRNELEYLRKRGFYQIRLYRHTGTQGLLHVSEAGQDAISDVEFDHILHNDHKLSDLKNEVMNRIIPQLKDKE